MVQIITLKWTVGFSSNNYIVIRSVENGCSVLTLKINYMCGTFLWKQETVKNTDVRRAVIQITTRRK